MYINDLNGCVECHSYKEYEQQIREMTGSGRDNEIQLYMRESSDGWNMDFPCSLSILIKENQAAVNYFSEGNEEMFASIGDMNRDDDFQWKIGAYDYSVAGYQILSIEKTLECALEFFHSQKKPACIEWETL
ncbi:MAG: hypothetical protein K2I96_10560 [Lachnospiraceae bacterium]|nr:hypothetical protein [Lachnospiraceae bacterium]